MGLTDWIMCALTFIYVVCTVATIWQMKKDREALYRPYIEAHFGADQYNGIIYLVIRNTGNSTATIQHILITPKIELVTGFTDLSFLNQRIVAPGQSFEFLCCPPSDNASREWKPVGDFQVDISYSATGATNKVYSDHYSLNSDFAAHEGYMEHTTNNQRTKDDMLGEIAHSQVLTTRKQM